MNASPRARRGMTTGDGLVLLAILSLGFALAYPLVEERTARESVARALAEVERVRAAALSVRSGGGAWPASAAPGQVPDALAPALPGGYAFSAEGYRLQWHRLLRVELPVRQAEPAPLDLPEDRDFDVESIPEVRPPTITTMGGLSLYTTDGRLLAALLERYGSARSFARDSSWTLVMPDASGSGSGGRLR